MVGNWLYGVAHQTAIKARARRSTRQRRERDGTVVPEPPAHEDELGGDLRPFLDRELSRLPDKYRSAIVLCDLEGKTRQEAALQLGLPEGTVASRLGRGRALLARRLAGRNLGLAAGPLGAALLENAAGANPPESVVRSTILAVSLEAPGQTALAGACSNRVALLAKGVLNAMWMSRLKNVVATLVATGFIVLAAGQCFPRAPADPPSGKQESPKKAEAEPPKDQVPGKSLDGVWEVVSLVDEDKKPIFYDPLLRHFWGIEAPVRTPLPFRAARCTFTFRGETFILKMGPVRLRGKSYLDPSATPKEIILNVSVGDGSFSMTGVYSLDGDNLTISFDKLAPSTIAGLGGKYGVRYTLRREAAPK